MFSTYMPSFYSFFLALSLSSLSFSFLWLTLCLTLLTLCLNVGLLEVEAHITPLLQNWGFTALSIAPTQVSGTTFKLPGLYTTSKSNSVSLRDQLYNLLFSCFPALKLTNPRWSVITTNFLPYRKYAKCLTLSNYQQEGAEYE